MQITKKYKLHEAQWGVFNDASRFVVLVAGRRFGKTVLALIKILSLAIANKKFRIWYVAPTYKQAELIAWRMLLNMIPHEAVAKKNEVKLSVELVNGSEISLKGADNEDNLRGVGLDYVVLDEYAMMKPTVWDEIIRPMLSDTKGKALFIGTPAGKNILYQLWQRGQNKEKDWSSYHYKTVDNPFIDKDEVDSARDQLPEIVFRQEYEASFEEYSGLCYPMFNVAEHVIEPIEIPAWWKVFRSMDYGYVNPFACVWVAVGDDGTYYLIDEHYEALKGIKEHALNIKKRQYQIEMSYIDPSACATTKEKNGVPYSVQMELNDEGIQVIGASRVARNVGISKVGELFKNGKLKVFRNCHNFIREIQSYRWKDTINADENAPEEPIKKNDHLLDALRYFCTTRELASDKPEVKDMNTARGHRPLCEADDKLVEIFESDE